MEKELTIDLRALVRRIWEGDRSAEDELVKHYLPSLRHILRNHYSDPELVQDIVQDTFIAVIQNLRGGKLKKPETLAGYIRSIALNRANDFLRKEARSTSTDPQVFETMSSVDDLFDNLQQYDLASLARKAIDALPEARDRKLLLMFYYYDVDKSALCEQFDITQAHFDRVKYRALRRLQKLFEEKTKQAPPAGRVGLMMLVMATLGMG